MLPEAIILHNSHYYEEMEAIREYLKSSKSLGYLERELENLISINYINYDLRGNEYEVLESVINQIHNKINK